MLRNAFFGSYDPFHWDIFTSFDCFTLQIVSIDRTWRKNSIILIARCCAPIGAWIKEGVEDVSDIPGDLYEIGWTPPVRPVVDPTKDYKADETAMRSGRKSRRQVIREGGQDPDAVEAEIIEERKWEKANGVTFTSSASVSPNAGGAPLPTPGSRNRTRKRMTRTMTKLDRITIASRAFNTPLMLDPAKAAVIAPILAGRLPDLPDGADIRLAGSFGEPGAEHSRPQPAAASLLGDEVHRSVQGRGGGYSVVEGAAIIPIVGSLVRRGSYVGASSGTTSYEGISAQIRSAVKDDQVRAIVLEVDPQSALEAPKTAPVRLTANGLRLVLAIGVLRIKREQRFELVLCEWVGHR